MEKQDVVNAFALIIIGLVILSPFIWLADNKKIERCTNKEYPKDYVSFNQKSHKYHDLDCECAQQCTVNCIIIERKEAIKRGGVPCKVCRGGIPKTYFIDDDDEIIDNEEDE